MVKRAEVNLGHAKKAVPQETAAPTESNYVESLEHKGQDEEKLHIISFFLNEVEYAFEVTDAVEVLRPREVTEVPRTPEFIRGILSVRGEMVPVMDLKLRLGAGPVNGRTGRILIASVEDIKAGFVVDRLSGVKEFPASSLGPVNGAVGDKDAEFLKGVIRFKDIVIRLLNAGRLIDFTSISR
ncbi:MAG: chemotaxis protein CheW [Deltaproteobacteria bacterium]|nr:chemotaxis protein CheW [Deltaproteobacteria bacterium]